MKDNYPAVSIITVNFNGKRHLKDLFDSIFHLHYPKDNLKVIFVDNVSTDKSIEFVRKNYPKVKIIKNDINNYCKGVNLGIEASEAEYAALVNNDIVLNRNWLIELIKVISKDKKIAAVGSKILNLAGKVQNAAHYELPNFYWGERGAGQDRNRYKVLEEVSSLCGAAVLYRKDALLEVGLFDEDFIIYGEDVDMSLRLRQRKYKLVFVPNSIVHHKFHGTATEEFARHYIERNRLLFLAKHYPHKLSSSLIGNGYFTVKNSVEACGKIYSIMPEVILKLIKTHDLGIAQEVISDLFEEMRKLINYENDILIKKFNEMAEDQKHANSEFYRTSKELAERLKEITQKEKEIADTRNKLADLSSQIKSRTKETLNLKQALTKTSHQLNQDKDRFSKEIGARQEDILNKEKLLREGEKELNIYKDELKNLSGQLKHRMEEVLVKDGQLIDKDAQIKQLQQEIQKNLTILQDKNNELAAYKDELQTLFSQLKSRKEELSILSGQLNSHKEELFILSGQLKSRMDEILLKDSQLIAQEKELTTYRDDLKNLSEQLKHRQEEVVGKEGQLIENRAENNALREELSRLAEELAAKVITIEENTAQFTEKELELKSYKEELSNISKLLEFHMEEVLIKDGQLIEKDVLIGQLRQEIQRHLNTIQERVKEFEEQLQGKERDLAVHKEELKKLSEQLKYRQEEIVSKENLLREKEKEFREQLQNKEREFREQLQNREKELAAHKEELNSIYNSEGFRFILRPLWTIIWNAREFLKISRSKLSQLLWFTICVLLTPVFIILSLSFLFEYISWVIFKPLLKITTPKRKNLPFEDIKETKVSIVIPNYNGVALLKECLPSIFNAEGFQDGENEVLVVDDGSTDGSIDFIKTHFPAVNLLRNKRNRGFGFTCNRGIKAAKNEIVVLINNDIILTKDFLAPLLVHLQRENVFTVTPKLYGWDKETFIWGMHMGYFKEGYIRLWNEAETGNGDKVNRASPSIFAIGGAMVFRKKDFLWLGGFEKIYRPNCWEDIDISYRAWKRGLEVIYEPRSLMYHKGRATLTYERPKEIKNELLFTWKNITEGQILRNHLNLLPGHLYRNKTVFLKGFFWALKYLPQTLLHRLFERRFAVDIDTKIFNRPMLYYRNFVRRGFKHPEGGKPNVLIVSRFLPYPLNAGGKIRIHTLVKLLSDRYNFILLSLIDHEDELKYIPKLKEVFSEIYTVHARYPNPLEFAFNARVFYPDRYKIAYSYNQEMAHRLKEIQKTRPLDAIHIESNELLYLIDDLRHVPVIYTEHDISILVPAKSYYRRNGNFLWSFFDKLKRIHFHASYFKKLDKVVTLSKEDEHVLRTFFPHSGINLVPTGVDLKHFSFERNKSQRLKKLIFVGHYRHYPNEDAVVYFVKKIFPKIRKRIPDAEFLIVGSGPSPRVQNLAKEKNVVLIGEVEDVKPYLDKAAIFVNSIRLSAGIKGKVLEAMAAGVPVVSTKVGSCGIDAQPEKEILIANTPAQFVRQVVRLFRDDKLRQRLAINARQLVENKYDWLKCANKLDALYKSLLFDVEDENSNFSMIDRIIEKTNDFVEKKIGYLNGCLIKPKEGPEELHIELTYDCNSKCIMCDLWDYKKRSPDPGRKELSLNEIKRFVEESRFLKNSKVVVLSGGEPFIRNDIVNLCGLFTKQLPQSSIGILTNGINTEAIVTKTKEILDRFQPKSLWLGSSLDGTGEEHDKIRGTKGAFSALYKTIQCCKKELPGVKLSVTFTLTPYNIDQLSRAKKFADNEGLDFFAQFVVPKEARDKFIWTPAELNLAEKEIIQIIKDIISGTDQQNLLYAMDKIKNKSLISQLYYWSNLVKYQTSPQRFFKKCIAGAKFAMFDPYGDLFFCPHLKDRFIGNVREEKFDRLWMSEKAQNIRTFIEKGNCHCWLVCIVFPILERALTN